MKIMDCGKRTYFFDEQGNKIGYHVPGRETLQDKVRAQAYYLEHTALCKALGLPVLWPNPLHVREALDLQHRANGGRKQRATKKEMAARQPVEKRHRSKKKRLVS